MKITIRYKEIILTIVYMYVFNPFKINVISSALQSGVFYSSIILYLLLNQRNIIGICKTNLSVSKQIKKMFLFWVASIMVSILVPILHKTFDFSYLTIIIFSEFTFAIRILFLLVLTKKLLYREHSLIDKFMSLFSSSRCLYVMFTVIMLIFPGFKEFWKTIVVDTERNHILSNYLIYRTRYGLAGFSGFRFTFFCTVGVIFLLFLITQKRYMDKRKKILYYAQLVVLIFGNLFYGRAGFLCSILCITVTIIYQLIVKKKFNLLFTSSVAVILLSFIIYTLKNINPFVNQWYEWAFEFLVARKETGEFSTAASSILFEDMYFKVPFQTFLFGEGYYTDPTKGGYYMSTDAGAMRVMLFSGVLGLASGYMITITLLSGLYKGTSNKSAQNRGYKFLAILLAIVFIFFEIKGEVFFMIAAFALALLLGINNSTGRKYQ